MDAGGGKLLRRAIGPARGAEQRYLRRYFRLLGLSPTGADAVTIITAAHIRLRRWRQEDALPGRFKHVFERIHRITAARDALLRRQVGGGIVGTDPPVAGSSQAG